MLFLKGLLINIWYLITFRHDGKSLETSKSFTYLLCILESLVFYIYNNEERWWVFIMGLIMNLIIFKLLKSVKTNTFLLMMITEKVFLYLTPFRGFEDVELFFDIFTYLIIFRVFFVYIWNEKNKESE
jgi:hypothetical protein